MKDKVARTIEALRRNGFDVWFVNNQQEAEQLFGDSIFHETNPSTVSWGDPLTLHALDITPKLRQSESVQLIETFGEELTWREQMRQHCVVWEYSRILRRVMNGQGICNREGLRVNKECQNCTCWFD